MRNILSFYMLIIVLVLVGCSNQNQIVQPSEESLLASPMSKPEGLEITTSFGETLNLPLCVSVDYSTLIRERGGWNDQIDEILRSIVLIVDNNRQIPTYVDFGYPTLGFNAGPPIQVCYEPTLEGGSHVATFIVEGTTDVRWEYSWVIYTSKDTATTSE